MDRLVAALGYTVELIAEEDSLDRLRQAASTETDPDRRSQLAARILLLMRAD